MCDIMERLMQESIEQDKIETIKNALAEKLPYDMIAKIVKLPVEEVKKLANT